MSTEPETPEPIKLRTAFVVFSDENGQWGASNDPKYLSDLLAVEKVAHPDEMDGGCASVRTDIAAAKAAEHVDQKLLVRAQTMQAKQEAKEN